MRQILVLSGKGGTGKTTVTGAMIELSEAEACADCDVDAPNLHLILRYGGEEKRSEYCGLPKAFVSEESCTMCGLCTEMCRFDAIHMGETVRVDPYACEGCGLCEVICPEEAIGMRSAVAGDLILRNDPEKGIFSAAQLRIGFGNSGLLVTEVKKSMKNAAEDAKLAIIDGSPGIGCPVIASISGADMVLIVTEPSVSGLSDMERILNTAEGLRAYSAVCINKADLNPEISDRIKRRCAERNIPFAGEIPYDPEAIRAVNKGLTLANVESPAGYAVRRIFEKVMKISEGRGAI